LNNNEGGVGGTPECLLIPVACLPDQIGTQTTLARAVAYAADPTREDSNASADQGADAITCSLGPNGADWDMESVLQDAIDFAVANGRGGKGTPIFWAVSNGNFPVTRDEVCSYQNTIAVGRSTRLDLEDGSAFGPKLDFLSPGVEVYSTRQGGGYGFSTGTSFAAPCAASVGALALAVRPDLTWEALRNRLRQTCDKIGPDPYAGSQFGGRNDRYGFGRVNAEKAVN
jgi:thermitase